MGLSLTSHTSLDCRTSGVIVYSTWNISLTQPSHWLLQLKLLIQRGTEIQTEPQKPVINVIHLEVHWPGMPVDVALQNGICEGSHICLVGTLKLLW